MKCGVYRPIVLLKKCFRAYSQDKSRKLESANQTNHRGAVVALFLAPQISFCKIYNDILMSVLMQTSLEFSWILKENMILEMYPISGDLYGINTVCLISFPVQKAADTVTQSISLFQLFLRSLF